MKNNSELKHLKNERSAEQDDPKSGSGPMRKKKKRRMKKRG